MVIYIGGELDRTLSFTLSGAQTPTPSPTATPTPTPGIKHLSCENKDNEEKDCCCFKEAHTYRFDPQYVSSVVAKFDTGRGLDCHSTVELQVDKGAGWETIKTVAAVSSSGSLELAPVEVKVPVNDTISGFRIYDGCVCCIDSSEITIYSEGTPPPTPTPTPTGTALVAESRTMAPSGTVQVPIRLEKAENIGSMNFVLTYDPNVLKVARVDKGSLLSGIAFAPNYKEPPVIRFGFATKDGVSGSGSVVYVEFEAIGSEGSSSPLTLSEILTKDISGQTISLSTQKGKVTIQQKTLKGDYNGDGKVTELDALAALRMSVNLLVENLILDMDNDGKVTAEDARLILEQAVTAR
ncbi:MAG: hypothetical protein J7K94_04380 [Dehalococcoidia bacterium]|nr:hypothetical protein [Dehalococcoidia bacterium]